MQFNIRLRRYCKIHIGISSPYSVNSKEVALRYTSQIDGAIGYLNACKIDSRVKTLASIVSNQISISKPATNNCDNYFLDITTSPARINMAPQAMRHVIASLSNHQASSKAITTLPLSIKATVATSPNLSAL